MSLYHMIHGVTNATFLILPMLGKHPDEYPRFGDCFTNDKEHPEFENMIHIYTRTGGGNREYYREQNKKMEDHENFVTSYDDSFDSTFASWIFSVPERWKSDFDLMIKKEHPSLLSNEYKKEIIRIFPKLEDQFKELFKRS